MRYKNKLTLNNNLKTKQLSTKGGNLMAESENKLSNEILESIIKKEEINKIIDELLRKNRFILNELVNYARNLMRRYIPLLNDSDSLDYVNEAFEKILSGQRVWDKNKYPDVTDLLSRIIWSCIMNEISSKTKKVENDGGRISRFESIYVTDENGESILREISDNNQDVEYEIHKKIMYEKIFEELEKRGDDEAYLVLERILDGLSNKEIAEDLGIDINKVVNARKRIINIGKKINGLKK